MSGTITMTASEVEELAFGALVAAGLTDELVIYYAPSLLGGDGRAMFQLPQVVTMADKVECSFSECTRVGPDLKVRLLLADT